MPLYDSLSTKLSKEWNAPDGKQELNQYLKEGVKLNKFSDGKNAIEQVLSRNSTFSAAQNWASVTMGIECFMKPIMMRKENR